MPNDRYKSTVLTLQGGRGDRSLDMHGSYSARFMTHVSRFLVVHENEVVREEISEWLQ